MSLITESLIFLIALILVVKSSDKFVEYAAKIAKKAGVSEFMIGITLVAIGTSLPELANMVISSLKGVNEFAFGNIFGSNMSNIGMSFGLGILINTIVIYPKIYRREMWMLIASTLIFLAFSLDGTLSTMDGAIMLVIFVTYMLYLTKVFAQFMDEVHSVELSHFVEYLASFKNSLWNISKGFSRDIMLYTLGLIATGTILAVASNILVDKAVAISGILGITSAGVGATIVAIGTTTPELGVSIASARKGFYRLLIGNIIGSNIANFLLIGGIGAIISPLTILQDISLVYSMSILLLATGIFAFLLSRKSQVSRYYGYFLLCLYGAFLVIMWLI